MQVQIQRCELAVFIVSCLLASQAPEKKRGVALVNSDRVRVYLKLACRVYLKLVFAADKTGCPFGAFSA